MPVVMKGLIPGMVAECLSQVTVGDIGMKALVLGRGCHHG